MYVVLNVEPIKDIEEDNNVYNTCFNCKFFSFCDEHNKEFREWWYKYSHHECEETNGKFPNCMIKGTISEQKWNDLNTPVEEKLANAGIIL